MKSRNGNSELNAALNVFIFPTNPSVGGDKGMLISDVIRAAIPGADSETCEFILWEMTPYPCGTITAQSLYRAASRFQRAKNNKRRLCELCSNLAEEGKWNCTRCQQALDAAASP